MLFRSNVLHVHDLVDFVSEEAGAAGRNAAAYVQRKALEGAGGKASSGEKDSCKKTSSGEVSDREIRLNPIEGVRYTVPATIRPQVMEDKLTVRFRVGNVYKNCYISVYFDEERVLHRKRPVVAPGEMEEIKLEREKLLAYPDLQTITVKIEEE